MLEALRKSVSLELFFCTLPVYIRRKYLFSISVDQTRGSSTVMALKFISYFFVSFIFGLLLEANAVDAVVSVNYI